MDAIYPSYLQLSKSIFRDRIASAWKLIDPCELCPRRCRVRRLSDETGCCKTGKQAIVCSAHPHFGEEAPLVGSHGSGTIFFSWCNLQCKFCQNYEISALGEGKPVDSRELSELMLELQLLGCHNINLVSPSHVIPQILEAVLLAAERGLCIPLVYNTGGYDRLETLKLLDGIVDIYMPDMKYADAEVGLRLSNVPDYPEVNQTAVLEMHRQVGDLVCDEEGIARRGLLIRHLVLPDGLGGTEKICQFIAEKISRNTYLNIMDQYHPSYKSMQIPSLNRRITKQEYGEAIECALKWGLSRLDSKRARLVL